jgi:hypothetical protein
MIPGILTDVFVVFLDSSNEILGQYLKLGYECFLVILSISSFINYLIIGRRARGSAVG